ncbi:hypothetical protein [Actinomadura sp. SCN-SB]|uniref:hypothetical protein n=1 Tax=Actinomadura sp. SCN-SB TaxID=3373092 RepID=UPI0037516660
MSRFDEPFDEHFDLKVVFACGNADLQVEALYRERRSVYRAIAGFGEGYWSDCQRLYGRLSTPPAIAALPASRRPAALAADEAARVAGAHLYGLDEAATRAAVTLSDDIARHGPPLAEAGTSRLAPLVMVTPPTLSGFLRFASGVGYTSFGVPLMAFHWGPLPEGTWLAWWADNRVAAQIDARNQGRTQEEVEAFLRVMGPLTFGESATTLYTGPEVELPEADLPSPQAIARGRALYYIAVAAWVLLTDPGAARLITRQPTPAQAAQDRRAGLKPRPATLATKPITARWPA